MGIPGFFGWILKKYKQNTYENTSSPTILLQSLNKPIDELYVDANCMLHPSCLRILNEMKEVISIEELEIKMINECIKDLDILIRYVKPIEKIYVAVDGVAPMAKINQQRQRRFKSYHENILKDEIRKKYNIQQSNHWTNASITPGTEFMEKLHIKILEFLKSYKTPSKQVIYSSYHTPGEGEHKIFNYIKKNKNSKTKVVYGLDADLIFLAMASMSNNILLIRENSCFSHTLITSGLNPYVYVSIDTLIKCFNEQIYSNILRISNHIGISDEAEKHILQQTQNNKNNIADVILICFLLGNDFLPHIPTIDIKKFGMEMILDSYANAYIKNLSSLVKVDENDISINMIFLDDFLFHLSNLEKDWMESYNENKLSIEPKFNNQCEREIWLLDSMKTIKSTDIFQKHIGSFDDWKFRYYEHHFHSLESQEQTIKEICKSYLDGIKWITKYYFHECPSWEWMFPYLHSPFISDLSKFVKSQKYNINSITFEPTEPLFPLTQLLCVLPPQLSYLLPKQYDDLTKSDDVGDLFPINFELDVTNKDMFWQCIPKLPILNIRRIKKETLNIDMNTEQNKLLNIFLLK